MDDDTLERFLSKVRILDNGCWEWTGTINEDGYGVFSIKGVNRLAHRVSYEHFVGRIPLGLHLDHLCHTRDLACSGGTGDWHRRCVCWVGHLEPVTPDENTRRGRSPFSINARKTHCIWGHEYTPANTYFSPRTGGRECRTCRRESQLKWMAVHNPGVRHGTETHCPQGHPYEGDNLKITVTGGRACRECQREWNRRYMRAKRALERGYLSLVPGSQACPVGHILDEDNSFVCSGQLVCLVCMTPDGSRSQRGAEALIAAANGALSLSGMLF